MSVWDLANQMAASPGASTAIARLVRGASLAIATMCSCLCIDAPAIAQEPSPIPVKEFEAIDKNGVILADSLSYHWTSEGMYWTDEGSKVYSVRIPEPSIGVGDPRSGGLSWEAWRTANSLGYPANSVGAVTPTPGPAYQAAGSNNLWGMVLGCPPVWPAPNRYDVGLGLSAEKFVQWDGNTFPSTQRTGGSLTVTSNEYIHHRGDGAEIVYEQLGQLSYCSAPPLDDQWGRIKSVTKPDGEVITWNYYQLSSGPFAGYMRLQSVTNNLGYQIHLQYEQDSAATYAELALFGRLKKVTAIDNALNPCAPMAFACSDSVGGEWPYVIFGFEAGGTVQTIADRLGNVSRYYYSGNIETPSWAIVHLIGYRSPAGASNDISIQSTSTTLTVQNASGTWVYGHSGMNATVSGPNGYSRTVTFGGSGPPESPTPSVPTADTLNGRTTGYAYYLGGDGSALIARVTGHEGDYVEYDYDARRNVTHAKFVAKPGSGLADVHQYASYPEAGVNDFTCVNTKTCNKPLTVTDARGNVSTFSYAASHGGLLTETKPAPGSGPYSSIQPQTRLTYGDDNTGIIRVTSTSTCATTSSCAGAADETVVQTTYNSKRKPSSTTTRAGDWSVSSTVAITYTPQGDVATVDGPLSGAVDTTYSYYDSMRRLRAMVTPDPDQGGPRLYGVARTTYDGDGNPAQRDLGEVSSPASWDSLTTFARSTFTYDTYGRKIRENQINLASGEPETVTQTKYDAAGRVECAARRMNPNVYGSLPDACTQSTAGAYGPDRIVRTTYDVNNDPLVIQSGFGTPLVRNERTMTYLAPGRVGTLQDAMTNLTTLEYDGFNRLKKTRYPVATGGPGWSSATDYEELGYDAASNVTSERRRDGLMAYNTYDNLNRLRFKDLPGSDPDVTNSHDNLNHLVGASSANGALAWGYDALGRVTSEVQQNGTVSYDYNPAGQRTQLTYPGGFAVSYQYYDNGALKLIGLNGTSDLLATYYYDELGRRGSMCRSAGTSTGCSGGARTVYGYDAISRLAGLSHVLTTGGSAYNMGTTFTYSPASQLVGRMAATSTYEWPYAGSFNDGYSVNGLNQYTTVAGQGLAYDGRGNTTNDTTKSYTYDSLNRLTGSSTNGASAVYDATGRLLAISQGGATTRFLYDGTRLIAEYDGTGNLQRRYVHGDGVDDPMVWFEGTGTGSRNHLFKDERGSVIASDDGSSVALKQYDEYGNASAGGYTGRFQYTGQTWMPELGLYNYKARFYNADLGRFMQTDPIGTKDQVNLYAYVGNDPLNRADPTGECSLRALTRAGAAIAAGGGPEDPIGDLVGAAFLIWDCYELLNGLQDAAPTVGVPLPTTEVLPPQVTKSDGFDQKIFDHIKVKKGGKIEGQVDVGSIPDSLLPEAQELLQQSIKIRKEDQEGQPRGNPNSRDPNERKKNERYRGHQEKIREEEKWLEEVMKRRAPSPY